VRVRFFFFAREAAGASSTRHSLRPLSFEGVKELKEFLQTSLRTNGSGERPPADRLREAIQNLSAATFWIASAYAKSASADSKPAIARESDGGSSQALLAMTKELVV